MSKLSKCPFCEGETNPEVDHEVTGYYVLCTWCGARTCGHQTREQAVEYWNTRELESKLQSTIAAQEDIIKRLREAGENIRQEAVTQEPFSEPEGYSYITAWDDLMNELGEK